MPADLPEPRDEDWWVARARALRAEDRHEEAVLHCAEAVLALPGRASVHREYGFSLLSCPGPLPAARRQEAYRAAAEAVRLDPDQAVHHYLAGLAAERLTPGTPWRRVARRAFREALRVDPEFAPARSELLLAAPRPEGPGRAVEAFAAAAAAPGLPEHRHDREVAAVRLLNGLRWIAVPAVVLAACVQLAVCHRPMAQRLTVSAAMTAVLLATWALWWARALRPLPRPARAALGRLVRTRGPVPAAVLGHACGSACALVTAAVPLPARAFYGGLAVLGLAAGQLALAEAFDRLSRASLSGLRRAHGTLPRPPFVPAPPPLPLPPAEPWHRT